MSSSRQSFFGGLLDRTFVLLLIGLATIGLLLLVILSFLPFPELGLDSSIVLFIVVTGLLIIGYMLGVVVVAFLAVFFLPRLEQMRKTGAKTTT
jgi:hypothetical protein